ncbi:MAG: SDR family NAD(P)-dependent oxidoreductase [Pseudomonadota bacterium]
MQLQGQVALVTGAGRGIGKAIALRFAREGADIAIADINNELAQATATEIRQLGREAFVKIADISDYDQVQTLVADTVNTLGKIDVLVNNAGIAEAQRFLEITKENWENHLKIHLFGTFYCSQAAARDMAKRKYGRIISIASVAGLMGPFSAAPYGAAKSGILGLTRAMSLELADYGVTANAIAPGPIDTELLRLAWSKKAYEERANHIPMRRLGKVEEIAHTALFLASPDSGYISGSVVVVDGGSVAAGAYMVEKYRRIKKAAL